MVGKIPKKNKRLGIDEYGRTALHYAEGDIDKLIKSGLDVDLQDDNGWTPLHSAAQEGNSELARKLIDAGASIGVRNSNGNTPLWVAVMNSQSISPVIELLLKNGADPQEKNNSGVSAIDLEPDYFKNEKT